MKERIFLSDLLRRPVLDREGGRLHLLDLAIEVKDQDEHPRVVSAYLSSSAGEDFVVPWDMLSFKDDVLSLHLQGPAGHTLDTDFSESAVPLVDDVLDSQILDLQQRRALRANDLLLRQDGKSLRLEAVDAGYRAVFRRLTRGWLRTSHPQDLINWGDVEFLRGDPHAWSHGERYVGRACYLPAGDLASLCELVTHIHGAELLTVLPPALAAATLQILSPQRRLQIFEELPEDLSLRLLSLMSADLAADLLSEFEREEAQRLLNALPASASAKILQLLEHSRKTAGGLMTNEILRLRASTTVAAARIELGEVGPKFAHFLYVIEDEGEQLLGSLELRELVTSREDQVVRDLVQGCPRAIHLDIPSQTAAYDVLRSHLAALPVVDGGGNLRGVISVGAALMEVTPPSLTWQIPRIFT